MGWFGWLKSSNPRGAIATKIASRRSLKASKKDRMTNTMDGYIMIIMIIIVDVVVVVPAVVD